LFNNYLEGFAICLRSRLDGTSQTNLYRGHTHGLASRFTMLATARSARKRQPKKIIVAVPTASLGTVELLMSEVDEIVCLNVRSGSSFAVADAYENWYDLTDEEAIKILLEKHKQKRNLQVQVRRELSLRP